jgi:hypothetical protein
VLTESVQDRTALDRKHSATRRWLYIGRMNGEEQPYRLPRDLLTLVRQSESELRKSVQRTEGKYLVYRSVPLISFAGEAGRMEITSADLLHFLEPLTRAVALDSVDAEGLPPQRIAPLRGTSAKKLGAFARGHFQKLRQIICGSETKEKWLTDTKTVALAELITALSAWLTQHFHMDAGYAKILATAILAYILSAARGKFCKMTDVEAKAAISGL